MEPNVDPENLAALERALANPARPQRIPDLGALRGFVYGLALSPDMVMPSEWIPVVMGDPEQDAPLFDTQAEAESAIGAMMGLYDEALQAFNQRDWNFSGELAYHGDAEADRPLQRWCLGFVVAWYWLEHTWRQAYTDYPEVVEALEALMQRDSVPEDLQGSVNMIAMLAHPELAAENNDDPERVWEFVPKLTRELGILVGHMAATARVFQRHALPAQGPAATPQRRNQPKVGRNQPCPCGSGKKHKHCCLGKAQPEPAAPTRRSVSEEILRDFAEETGPDRARQGQPTGTAAALTGDEPQADFDGLTPEQFYAMLSEPFDSPQVVRFTEPLAQEPKAPMISLLKILLEGIGEDGLKRTAKKGNLPLNFCNEAARQYLGEENFLPRFGASRLRTETDFKDLHLVRVVAELGGLIDTHKSRFVLTDKAIDTLARDGYRGLYPIMFRAYARELNWAYVDSFEKIKLIQFGSLFSLYLLSRHGHVERTNRFYEDAFLRAFPQAIDEAADNKLTTAESRVRTLYTLRTLVRFTTDLGLASVTHVGVGEHQVVKTDLLDEFVHFQVPTA